MPYVWQQLLRSENLPRLALRLHLGKLFVRERLAALHRLDTGGSNGIELLRRHGARRQRQAAEPVYIRLESGNPVCALHAARASGLADFLASARIL